MELKKAENGPWFYSKALGFLLNKSRTYILPTAFGWAFSAMVIVLFIMAIGFANNLIYLITFFLISVAVTAMVLTNQNISHLRFSKVKVGTAFAQEPSEIQVQLESEDPLRTLWDLQFSVQGQEVPLEKQNVVAGHLEVRLPWVPTKRGWHEVPRLIVSSRYPFWLFKSWQRFRQPAPVLVYPFRTGKTLLPFVEGGFGQNAEAGVFKEHRAYQTTDSPKRIDWKASARRQEILIKTFENNDEKSLALVWKQTGFLENPEERISQLALWVDLAEKQGLSYSLEIGAHFIEKGKGTAHLHRCFEFLALLKPEELPQ